ncbi:MAG: tetratricopeptide repeat protein [Verrucomicrobiaceae bacterium]|nr:MAG: tetratricopeptide repeat protein [Verrucomicrobiaceae bacterium]
MSPDYTRAQLLRERGRHEEAVATLLSHLAHFPEDPRAFLELAINRMELDGQLQLALEDARTATGLMPGSAYPLSLQSRILSQLQRPKEALPMAESALALDPEFGHAWNSKAIALIGLSRWKEAEECTRAALELDADDEGASNLLAHTLRIQNRLDESEEESKRRLARNPENAFSFANAGWSALQRGDIKGAEGHFKESLRIDPNMEHARTGLKQSYRARSAFFRLFLKWSFFLQRFSENNRMAIIIGLVIGFKVLRTLAASVDPLLVIPVALVYFLFVFGSWLSDGIANFLLLRDPVARLSLDRGEKIEGGVIGILFFGGLVALVAGFSLGNHAVGIAGGVMMATTLPASMVFTNPSTLGRAVFGLISAGMLIAGTAMALDVAAHPGREIFQGTAGALFPLVALLGAGSTWLGMIPKLRRNTPV